MTAALIVVGGLVAAVTGATAQAASWHVDSSFGKRGIARVPGGQGEWSLLAPGPQGSLFVGAGMGRGGSFAVERLSAHGKPVRSFGHDGIASTDAVEPNVVGSAQMFALPGGKLLISGLDGNTQKVRLALARFTAGGRLDRGFGHDGVAQYNLSDAPGGTTGQVYVGVAANGDILAVHPIAAATPGSIEIVRLLPSGALDHSFGSGGFVKLALPGANLSGAPNSAMAVAPDGSVLLAFAESGALNSFQPAVQELSPSGAPAGAFGNDGLAPIAPAIDPGSSTFNGLFSLSGGFAEASLGYAAARSELVRLSPAGTLDPIYGSAGVATIDRHVWALALGPGEETFYAGSAGSGNGAPEALVVGGVLSNGEPDPALGGAAGMPLSFKLPPEAGAAVLPGPGVLSILDNGYVVRLRK